MMAEPSTFARVHVDLAFAAGVEHRVAHQVLDGAVQQTRVAGHLDFAVALVADVGSGRDRFELRVVQHVVNDVVEVDQLELRLQLSALQSGDGQDALQHGVQLHRVLLDAVQHLGAILLIGVARDGQRQAHARDGRAQFVRNAAQQIAFTLDLVAQLAGHDVEVAHQVGDFVLAIAEIFAGANVEIAARQFVGGIAQALDGLGEVVRDQQTDKRRDRSCPSFRVQRMSPGTRSPSAGGVSSAISRYCPCGVVARAASTFASNE